MKVAASALAVVAAAAALLPPSAVALRGGSSGGGSGKTAAVEDASSGVFDGASSGRSLQDIAAGGFSPLTCNTDLDNAVCQTWTAKGFTANEAGVVEIPCNECVTMSEFTGSETVTVGGLNVLGRLDFPPGTKVTVETPSVFVQGKLSMSSNSPVSGDPEVKIVMTGDTDQSFSPAPPNEAVCAGGTCTFGPKSIVVAGGQLDIDALDDTCPTWSYVQNFSNDGVPVAPEGTYATAPVTPEGCTLSVVDTTFDDPNLGNGGLAYWTGNLGAVESLAEPSHDGTKYMHVERRTNAAQGPLLNLRRDPHRKCLEAGTEYFFQAKVKLEASSLYPGHVSECSQTGANCLKLKYASMASDDKVRWLSLTSMTKAAPADGTWFDFTGSFKLRDLDVNATNIFQVFSVSGPEKQVDIDIDDIRVGLFPANMFPDPTDPNMCSELIINGGADMMPGMTFPFFSWRKNAGMNKLELLEENGNKYFRVSSRSSAPPVSEIDTIAYTLPHGCLLPGATYAFSAKYRLNSDISSNAMVQIRTETAAGAVRHDRFITSCPPSSNTVGWVTCTGELQWNADHTTDADRVDVLITLKDTTGADVDFDDISFSFKSGAPTGGLNLDAAITDQCYAEGARAVIPSDEIRWEPVQEVTVQSIPSGGVVNVNETYGLDTPVTVAEDANFAGQFMFLSRNVEFSGDGGTLTVLGTNAAQKIQGAAFVGFGVEGQLGKNPINFREVSDASTSLVTKNAITLSKNRCVQVQGTNNLYVGENVAYNNRGHCYALQEGSEVGNVFEKNIAASVLQASGGIAEDPDNIDHTEVAAYFVPSPGNSWIGNVAAGSQMMGFYFRQRLNVIGATADANQFTYPFQTPIVQFSGNVAHSNAFNGVEVMGYNPLGAQLFEDTRSYKNRGQAVNIRASSYLTFDGGVLADSRNGIDVFKADNVVIRNANVIGYSMSYLAYTKNNKDAKKLCTPGGSESVVGVRFHPNKKKETPGLTVENVSFSRFGLGSECEETPNSGALGVIDRGITEASFTTSVSLTNLTFEEGSRPEDEISLCPAEAAGVTDIIIADTDGSLNPEASGAGTVMSTAATCAGTEIAMPDVLKTCAKYCLGGTAPDSAPAPGPAGPTFPSATPDPSAIPPDVAASTSCFSNYAFEQAGLAPWMALPGPQVSSALTTGFGGTGQSVVVHSRQNQARGGLYQSLSNGCLTADAWYEVSADVRLMQGGTQTPFLCKPGVMWYTNQYSCGFMTLLFGTAEPKVRQEVAAFVGPYQSAGEAWNRYYGAFKATADVMSQQSTIMLMVAGAPAGVDMYVDNVVFKEVTDISTSLGAIDCSSPVVNGDFETADLTGWMIRGNGGDTEIGELSLVDGAGGPGTYAVRHSGRPNVDSRFNGLLQKIPSYCFVEGATVSVSAKFRYFAPDGTAVPCVKNATAPVDACPTFEFEAAGTVRSGALPNTDTDPMVVGGWNALTNSWTVTAAMSAAATEAKKDTNPFWRDMWFKVSAVYQEYAYEMDDIVMTITGP